MTKIKLDTREFDRTLREYRKYSKRDLATIVNTKALFIARRAVIETPKADKRGIKALLNKSVVTQIKLLGQKVRVLKGRIKRGGYVGQKVSAPLAALIVNARRGRDGQKGLYGAAMEEAVKRMVGARLRSVAFLKSGWIPAIKRLWPLADHKKAPREDRSAEQLGREKGYAKPAVEGPWKVRAEIANLAGDNEDNKGALITYGQPALQRAVDAETLSTREYIEEKLKQSADRAGIKRAA